jgi:hypothetical protein
MAKLFDIVDTKIVPDAKIMAIPIMKELWDRDRTKGKEKAFKEYSYIAFLCDYNSPYKDLSEDIKEDTIIKDLFKSEKWEPDQLVKDAIDKYNQLQETRHLRMLKSYEHIEDQITSYNNKIDLEATDDFGKAIYNIKDIVQSAEKIGNIIKSISILEKQVQTEIAEASVRGQAKIGSYELPRNTGNVE